MVAKWILNLGFVVVSGLAGLAVTGCSTEEEAGTDPEVIRPASPEIPPFQRELRQLKRTYGRSPAFEPAFRELMERYGYPVDEDPAKGGHGRPDEGGQPGTAAGKVAAGTQYLLVKDLRDTRITTAVHSVTVLDNEILRVSTYGSVGATDPMVVAYTLEGSGDARTVKVLGVGIDSAFSLEAQLGWHNGTGTAKNVSLLFLAESYANRGKTNYKRVLANASTYVEKVAYRENVPVGGRVYFDNNLAPAPPAGCTGPSRSRIKAWRHVLPGNVDVMAVNKEATEGSWVRASDQGTSFLGTYIASGAPAFVAVYESSGLVPVQVGSTEFSLTQEDSYDCVQ